MYAHMHIPDILTEVMVMAVGQVTVPPCPLAGGVGVVVVGVMVSASLLTCQQGAAHQHVASGQSASTGQGQEQLRKNRENWVKIAPVHRCVSTVFQGCRWDRSDKGRSYL